MCKGPLILAKRVAPWKPVNKSETFSADDKARKGALRNNKSFASYPTKQTLDNSGKCPEHQEGTASTNTVLRLTDSSLTAQRVTMKIPMIF